MAEKRPPRASYTSAFKLKVVLFAEQNGNRAAGRNFSVDEKCVWRWRSQKENLKRIPRSRHAERGRRAQFPELEEDLTAWITSKRREGVGVSTTVICLKAKGLARENVIAADKFKASQSWCYKFLACNGFSIRPILAHILVAETQILAMLCET